MQQLGDKLTKKCCNMVYHCYCWNNILVAGFASNFYSMRMIPMNLSNDRIVHHVTETFLICSFDTNLSSWKTTLVKDQQWLISNNSTMRLASRLFGQIDLWRWFVFQIVETLTSMLRHAVPIHIYPMDRWQILKGTCWQKPIQRPIQPWTTL